MRPPEVRAMYACSRVLVQGAARVACGAGGAYISRRRLGGRPLGHDRRAPCPSYYPVLVITLVGPDLSLNALISEAACLPVGPVHELCVLCAAMRRYDAVRWGRRQMHVRVDSESKQCFNGRWLKSLRCGLAGVK